MNNPLIVDSNETNIKIKALIQTLIENKNKALKSRSDQMEADINSIKTQEQADNYFVPLQSEPKFTTKYVGLAIISILSDIIGGIGEATKQIKLSAREVNGQNNIMRGGVDSPSDPSSNPSSTPNQQQVENMADNLSKLIVQAQDIISNIEQTQKSNLLSNNSNNNNKNITTNLLQTGLNEASKIGKIAVNTGIQASEYMINTIIDFVLDATGNNNLIDKSWQELSPELNKKLLLFAAVLKELSENPATKEAIKEIAKVVAVSMVELMKEIEPDIDMITDQTMTMFKEIANKSVHGATATGISVLQAFLAEIPFVGGILDLTIAIGKGFNALMKVFNVLVSRSSDIGTKGTQTIINTSDKLNEIKSRLSDEVDKVKRMLDEPRSTQTSQLGQLGGQGRMKNNGKLNSHIMKNNKRLRKTLKLFHTTLPKMKYTTTNHKENDRYTHPSASRSKTRRKNRLL